MSLNSPRCVFSIKHINSFAVSVHSKNYGCAVETPRPSNGDPSFSTTIRMSTGYTKTPIINSSTQPFFSSSSSNIKKGCTDLTMSGRPKAKGVQYAKGAKAGDVVHAKATDLHSDAQTKRWFGNKYKESCLTGIVQSVESVDRKRWLTVEWEMPDSSTAINEGG